jgi:hypothetical protein
VNEAIDDAVNENDAIGDTGGGGEPVVVRDRSVLDLSRLTSPGQFATIGGIEDVALVVVPESLAAAYLAIPLTDVASTVYVRDGVNVRTHTGMMAVPGDGIGAENDVLVVVGGLIITSPVTGPLPHQIVVTGAVLAPRGTEAVLGPVLAAVTGSVSYYRYTEGQDIKLLSGQVKLSPAVLANRAGRPDDILIAAGEILITGQVSEIGYGLALAAGTVAAPEDSRDVLETRIEAAGQVAWYPGDRPRTFHSATTLGAGFFRQLDEPVTIVAFSRLTILPDVTESLLREKVLAFVLFGPTTAPAELLGVIQFLATDVFGPIQASDGSGS